MSLTGAKIKHLVVDTNTFIKNSALQNIAENIYTVQDVLDEISSKRQLRNLVVLPYNIIVKDVFGENIKQVTDFSKKTGDFRSLSAADIKVIALTLQLEKEFVGTSHLKEKPEFHRVITTAKDKMNDDLSKIVGFYMPQKKGVSNGEESSSNVANITTDTWTNENVDDTCGEIINRTSEISLSDEKDLSKEVENEKHVSDEKNLSKEVENEKHCVESIGEVQGQQLVEENVSDEHQINSRDKEEGYESCEEYWENVSEGDEDYDDDDDDDDDDSGWITPSNIAEVTSDMGGYAADDKPVVVACVTSDFAMQNVIRQLGLNVVSIDGRLIRQLRTYIFRCYGCFKTTSVMTHVFCPNCGHKTLKKVAVSIREDGTQEIYINTRRPLSAKGKRFTLPTMKGGKHANNPIICIGQRVPHQMPSKRSQMKTNPLSADYTAGFSPFVMRDVTSRSAMLGIHGNNVKNYFRNSEPIRRRKK